MFAVRQRGLSFFCGICVLVAGPAQADVKAGVDAWTRGDFAAAVAEWETPASNGDADALFNLGQAYKLGRGVPQDMAKAEGLFGRAAAQGHMQASDNYGLMLFQRGDRAKALPYISAAADRGDPRSQYLLGIASFNGDNVPKDWVRAYALVTLAHQGGLAQAAAALSQMDQHIPLEQRQKSVPLARQLAAQAKSTRDRQFAAAGLGGSVPNTPAPAVITALRRGQAVPPGAATGSPRIAQAGMAWPRITGTLAAPKPAPPLPAPALRPAPPMPAMPARAGLSPLAPAAGNWRVQLGVFGVPGNAEALWERVKSRPELAGHARLLVASGKLSRLLADGYASQGAAQSACARLSTAGISCLVVAN